MALLKAKQIDGRVVLLSSLSIAGMLQFAMTLMPHVGAVRSGHPPAWLIAPSVGLFLLFAFALRAAFAKRLWLASWMLAVGGLGALVLIAHDLFTSSGSFYFFWWRYALRAAEGSV